jgi:hypothetical protein
VKALNTVVKPLNNGAKPLNNGTKPLNNGAKPLNVVANKPMEEDPEIPMSNQTPLTLSANEPLTLTPSSEPKGTLGKTYIPTPMVAPMKGGRRVTIKNVTLMPKKVLKGLAGLFKRSRKLKGKRSCSCGSKRKHRR